jgi:hypothetical protein
MYLPANLTTLSIIFLTKLSPLCYRPSLFFFYLHSLSSFLSIHFILSLSSCPSSFLSTIYLYSLSIYPLYPLTFRPSYSPSYRFKKIELCILFFVDSLYPLSCRPSPSSFLSTLSIIFLVDPLYPISCRPSLSSFLSNLSILFLYSGCIIIRNYNIHIRPTFRPQVLALHLCKVASS